MLWFAALALVAAIITARRAAPILCAALSGWLVWTLIRDAAASTMVALAALLVASWFLDAAASHWRTRRLTVGMEMAAAALVAGGLAFLIAGGEGPHLVWIVGSACIAAMAIVARWRNVAVSPGD